MEKLTGSKRALPGKAPKKLAKQLNPSIEEALLASRLEEMLIYDNYMIFGLFDDEKFIGMSGAWILTRFYSGKQNLTVPAIIVCRQFFYRCI